MSPGVSPFLQLGESVDSDLSIDSQSATIRVGSTTVTLRQLSTNGKGVYVAQAAAYFGNINYAGVTISIPGETGWVYGVANATPVGGVPIIAVAYPNVGGVWVNLNPASGLVTGGTTVTAIMVVT